MNSITLLPRPSDGYTIPTDQRRSVAEWLLKQAYRGHLCAVSDPDVLRLACELAQAWRMDVRFCENGNRWKAQELLAQLESGWKPAPLK